MGELRAQCLAAVTKQIADDTVAKDARGPRSRFVDWIDLQAGRGGSALRAFAERPAVNATVAQREGAPPCQDGRCHSFSDRVGRVSEDYGPGASA